MKSLKQRDSPYDPFISVSGSEKALLYIKSIGIMLLIDYSFYQSLAVLPLLIPVGYWFYCSERKELIHQKRLAAGWQFKEMLLLTVAGQRAGYSVENALLKSYTDLASLYGDGSSICRMLHEIKNGLENQLPLSGILKEMSRVSGIEEMREFAEVFAIAKESSGNMTSVMERTAETISSKAQTRKEIETILSARKMEQKIMNLMPFFLIVYINLTSPGYFSGLYHSLSGIFIMTICLLIYIAAYLAGAKISAIRL